MKFVTVSDPKIGVVAVVSKIRDLVKDGKRVLWLVPGGSNIPISVEILSHLIVDIDREHLKKHLSVMLTDERYGHVGHADSNWQQLIDHGFNFDFVNPVPTLSGLSFEETVKKFGENAEERFQNADAIIGQFGVGHDGHIAGIIPHSPVVGTLKSAEGFKSDKFVRITLTPHVLSRVTVAYAFVSGESKKVALINLKEKDLSLDEEPCQILKKIGESYVYTDQIV